MPTMNIKDPEVHRLATELARLRGSSLTAAVRAALTHEVERETRARRIDWAVIESMQAELRSGSARLLADADLYDEHGLPR